MRVSYTWLRELVEIPYTAKELGEVLTQQGMAVDALEHWGRPYEGIVVGVIKGVAKHPSADNLSICQVDVGREVLQVVCGAPNVGVGQHVAVAQVGARIGDRMIERTKVRGVESEGMCCAADELGISGDHSGLLILDASFGAGTPLERVVSGEDYIFELDIANNRPDLLCHIGIAREIWAHLRRRDGKGGEYQPPRFELEERGGAVGDAVRVEVEDMALCPRYTARVVEEVRIGPSPVWMQARLYRLGMRPINNVVDITNYVMLEYGHPLHAFDGEQLEGRRIVVRRARRGERLVTLDGVERELDEGMIVIADEARGVAIAGVMGGENTEVRATTRQIVLESAYFEPGTIRRAAKLLGLHSESSRRFERGVRGAAVEASARAAQLMSLYAGGVVRRGMLDVGGGEKKRRVRVRLERCEGLLGMKLAGEAVEKTLRTLGFGCEDVGGSLVVSVPEHRVDVVEEADIAEEIARVWGYQGVPIDAGTPFRSNVPVGRVYACRAILRELLAAEGLYEAYNPSLVSEELLSRAGVRVGDHEQGLVALANATTQEQSVLRTAVYPGLLRNVQHNIARGAKSVRLFELGRVYRRGEGGSDFIEREWCGLVLWGAATEQGIWAGERKCDVHDAKGVLEVVLDRLGVKGIAFEAGEREGWHPGRTAVVKETSRGKELGWVGELHPRVVREWDISGPVAVAELDVEVIAEVRVSEKRYVRLPRFPAATRDVAIVVPARVSHAEVMGVIRRCGGPLLRDVTIFDRYQGEQIPAGCVSMAYHIEYRSEERTLTDEEVDMAHAALVAALEAELGAQVRA